MDDLEPPLMDARRPDRNGFALVLVLAALTVLAGIVSAAMAAGLGQLRGSAAAARASVAGAAAEAALFGALAGASGAPGAGVGDTAVVLATDSLGAGGFMRALDLRVTAETHLFLGEASADGGAPMRRARLAWWMDPELRASLHRAVVESAAVQLQAGGVVASDSMLAGRRGIPACDGLPRLRLAFGSGPVPMHGAPPGPPEWEAGGAGTDFADIRFGWFGRSALAAAADDVPIGGEVPVSGCAGCWSGLVFVDGDAHLAGEGGGVLAVNGSIDLAPGSSWTGLVLASGDVTLRSAARVVGLVRAAGTVSVASGAEVDGSACAVLEALRSAPSLYRPIPVPGRSALGPLPPGRR